MGWIEMEEGTKGGRETRAHTAVSIQGLLHMLSCPRRYEIIRCLTDQEKDVSTIVRDLDLYPSEVSSHLRLLRTQGLVEMRKEKTRHFYRVNRSILHSRVNKLLELRARGEDGAWLRIGIPLPSSAG